MGRCLLAIAMLCALGAAALAQDAWEWIGPEYTNIHVIAVDADGAIFIGGMYMGTLVSEDEGATWTQLDEGPGDPTEMVTTPAGTVVCTDGWGYGVCVTSDKGATWDRVTVQDEYEWVSQLAVHPLTGDVYAAINNEGGLHVSSDGGYSWQPLPGSPLCIEYWDLAAGGNAHLWVKGDAGFWRSEDYAASWIPLAVPAAAENGGLLSFAPSFALFMAGYDTTAWESHLLRSWDFGDTWVELAGGLPEGWGEYRGIAYGRDWGTMLLADGSMGVHRSEDMGDTWTLYNEGLSSTYVLDVVNGPGCVHYLATVDAGVFVNRRDAVAALDSPAAPRAVLAQNHPNPFNPTTTLSFTLCEPGPVRLTLHDTQGRLLRTLATGRRAAGAHVLELDARALPSGCYVYRLEAGGTVLTRRLTLLK